MDTTALSVLNKIWEKSAQKHFVVQKQLADDLNMFV